MKYGIASGCRGSCHASVDKQRLHILLPRLLPSLLLGLGKSSMRWLQQAQRTPGCRLDMVFASMPSSSRDAVVLSLPCCFGDSVCTSCCCSQAADEAIQPKLLGTVHTFLRKLVAVFTERQYCKAHNED